MEAYAKIQNREYTGEMPYHYSSVVINGVSICAMNLFPTLIWDKEIVNHVVEETIALANNSESWFKVDKSRLEEIIRSEIAVNKAARLGKYKHEVGYFAEWLEERLRASLLWMGDAEGETIARMLMALVSASYGKRDMKYDDGYRKGWECAVAWHKETQFIEDAAKLFA